MHGTDISVPLYRETERMYAFPTELIRICRERIYPFRHNRVITERMYAFPTYKIAQ